MARTGAPEPAYRSDPPATTRTHGGRSPLDRERQRMERALKESERRLAGILESALDAIVTFEEGERRIRLCNSAAERVLGMVGGQAIGRPIDRFLTPSLRGFVDQARQHFDRSREQVMWLPPGLSARRADGESFPVEGSISRATVGGEVLCTLIVRDLAERQRAEAALARLELERGYLQEELETACNFGDIVGESEAIRRVLAVAEGVAPTAATVLIQGETGTGKELVARAIHRLSARSEAPMVRVNCAALPASLVESELFGHERGAFTGAERRRIGRFELADGGTLFLDEIGELPLPIQAKLLRVLQDGRLERVGGSETMEVDVRVIAATNRQLDDEVAAGRFRPDLFYRLNVFPLRVPPLRERREDIPLLVNHFVLEYASRLGKRIDEVSPLLVERLMTYRWPGNVRELENVVERAVILSQSDRLEAGDWLPREAGSNGAPAGAAAAASAAPAARDGDGPATDAAGRLATLDEAQRRHILAALEKTGWVVSGPRGAAKLLDLKPTTLESRMKKLGIRRKGR